GIAGERAPEDLAQRPACGAPERPQRVGGEALESLLLTRRKRLSHRFEAIATNVEAGRDQHQLALAREYSARRWHPGGMEAWRRMIHRRDVSARSLRVRAVVLITLFVAACGGSGEGTGSGNGSPDAGADGVTIGWTQAAITTTVTKTVGVVMAVRWRCGGW